MRLKSATESAIVREVSFFLSLVLAGIASAALPAFSLDSILAADQQQGKKSEIVLVDPQKRTTIKTIVIDPGHGGDETGAEGKDGVLEKNIVMDIAGKLKSQLMKIQGLKVILTRDKDMAMPLDERTAIANHNHADLFISIHVNASKGKKVRGAETFFLSNEATDEEVRTLAALENNAVGLSEEKSKTDRDLQMVLWDMAQTQYLQESSELAESIQKEFNEMLGIKDRGIKQAPFRVLMGATMPAVLVEVGFLSNPEEEEKLKTSSYQDEIASAIFKSVMAYKDMVEKRVGRTGIQDIQKYTNQ